MCLALTYIWIFPWSLFCHHIYTYIHMILFIILLQGLLYRYRRSPIGCLIILGHFPQESPMFSGSCAENDLQLESSYRSSPPRVHTGDIFIIFHFIPICICIHKLYHYSFLCIHITYGIFSKKFLNLFLPSCVYVYAHHICIIFLYIHVTYREFVNFLPELCRAHICMYKCTLYFDCIFIFI